MRAVAALLWAAGAAGAANPPEVRFELALPEGRAVWRQGERIPLRLSLSSTLPDRWIADLRLSDRIGRVNRTEQFLVEPADGVRDPLAGLPGADGSFGGVSGAPQTLTEAPLEYARDLNEWVWFERPGTYRLTVRTTRVFEVRAPGADGSAPSAQERLTLTSNTVTLRITAPDAEWAEAEAERALELFGPGTGLESAEDRIRRGVRMLRFLRTERAAREMVAAWPYVARFAPSDLRLGLSSSPHRAAALPLMEQRLTAPDQPADRFFVDTLTSLAGYVREDPLPPLPPEGPERAAWQELSRERRLRWEARRRDYYDRLAGALDSKTGSARSTTAAALSEFMLSLPEPPAWRPAILRHLRDGFEQAPARERNSLLASRWYEIAGPEMVPSLKRIHGSEEERSEIRGLALRRLFELEPATARRLVVDGIVEAGRLQEAKTLALVEDATLPQAFDLFRAHLEAGSFGVDPLVLRFGDESLAGAARTALGIRERQYRDAGQADCLSVLHSFLLREAPEAGEIAFRRAFASGVEGKPHCLDLRRIVPAGYAWSPALERLLGEIPVSGVPVIAKDSAAELLGRYGSAEAEKALWAAMEAFHGWWEGREDELRDEKHYEGWRLERTLWSALALGNGWALDADEMRRLRGLCVSDACRAEVDRLIADSAEPLRASVSSVDPENFSVNVGRFHLRSMEALRAKVEQLGGARIERRPIPPRLNVPYAEERVREVRRLLGME